MRRRYLLPLVLAAFATTAVAQQHDQMLERLLADLQADDIAYDAAANRLTMRGHVHWFGEVIPAGEVVCDGRQGFVMIKNHDLRTDERYPIAGTTCSAIAAALRASGRLPP